ncbi:hypothetical protein ACFWXO_43755 [Kitasatospora sp. NPDC059088]|uniref:hypothetical protein n=1 Tax=Kitasatospora sp. NPDC059088 TaxID=3346722 RepID=UPI00368C851B
MTAHPHPPIPSGAIGSQPSDHDLAEALATGTVLLELPYRGHRTQVVATPYGAFGRRDRLGCFLEIAAQTMHQWTPFPNPEAATAWCRNTAAASLYGMTPARVDQNFAVWHGNGWSVEIDLRRQRYIIAVGLHPGTTYEVLAARETPDEPLAAAEARGWAWLIDKMPEPLTHWPTSMVDEYCRRGLLAAE